MEFKKGQSFRAIIPYCMPRSSKVHIDHVLPSIYDDVKLIIYRVYGQHKQWWHEFMCYDRDMKRYVELYNKKTLDNDI